MLSAPDALPMLREHPILGAAPRSVLDALAEAGRYVTWGRGEPIFPASPSLGEKGGPSPPSPVFGLGLMFVNPRPYPGVMVLLRGSVVASRWRGALGQRCEAWAYDGDCLGVDEHLTLTPPQRPAVDSDEALTPGHGYYFSDADWAAIGALGGAAWQVLQERLALAWWASASTHLAGAFARHRLALAAYATLRTVPAGTVLARANQRSGGLGMVLARGKVTSTETWDALGPTATTLGLGDLVGADALIGGRSTADVVTDDVTDLLWIPRAKLVWMRTLGGSQLHWALDRLTARLRAVRALRQVAVSAWHAGPLAGIADVSRLPALLQTATVERWGTGSGPPALASSREGFTVVGTGEVVSGRVRPYGARVGFELLSHHPVGSVLGGPDLPLHVPAGRAWRARAPTLGLFVPADAVRDRCATDPWAVPVPSPAPTPGFPDLPLLLVDRTDGAPWTDDCDRLALLLAAEIDATWQESTLVVRVALSMYSAILSTVVSADAALGWVRAQSAATVAGVATTVTQALAAAVAVNPNFAPKRILLLWPTPPTAPFSTANLAPTLHRLYRLHFDPSVPPPPPPLHAPTVHAWGIPLPPASAQGHDFPPSTVRVRMDLGALLGSIGVDPLVAPQAARAALVALPDAADRMQHGGAYALAALARGLTNRRVGVALSGGETWGFAHRAVLWALSLAGIPVDAIAGVSVGAVVGACWVVAGDAGLEEDFLPNSKLIPLSALSALTSVGLQAFLSQRFGHRHLEDCVPLLLPMGTNVELYTAAPVFHGEVAAACRKAGSMVPLYAATPTEQGTLVDGAFSDNLPTDPLVLEGLRIIVASNAMALPPTLERRAPRYDGTLVTVLRDLWLPARVRNAVSAGLSLGHSVGGSSADLGDASYALERPTVGIVDVANAPQVAADALAHPVVWQLMLRIRAELAALADEA